MLAPPYLRDLVRLERLELLDQLVDQLVQCEQHVAVRACTRAHTRVVIAMQLRTWAGWTAMPHLPRTPQPAAPASAVLTGENTGQMPSWAKVCTLAPQQQQPRIKSR